MRVCFNLLVLGVLILVTGCMSIECDIKESYEPSSDIQKFTKAESIPYQYKVIGSCKTSGNYQDFSIDDMTKKIIICGEDNGADAVFITSMRVMPAGRVVAFNPTTNVADATSAATANTWEEINKDFDGGYGSIRNKNVGTSVNYERIVTAELIRYLVDENGDYLPALPMANKPVIKVDIKEEIKSQKAAERTLIKSLNKEKKVETPKKETPKIDEKTVITTPIEETK